MKAVEVNELVKIYNLNSKQQIIALDHISLDVHCGKITAILCPNGAGKSTLFKILLKLIKISSGEVKLFDKNIDEFSDRNMIGYLPELFQPDVNFKAEEFLRYFGELSGIAKSELNVRIDELLEIVDLKDVRNQKIKTFSKGMLQRLLLAQAMLHQPKLLLLDEPTDGLDPIGKKQIQNLLVEMKKQGVAIVINSHLLSEVELLADELIILKKGKVVAQGNLMELLPETQRFEIVVSDEPPADLGIRYKKNGNEFLIDIESTTELKRIITEMNIRNINILLVKPIKTSLEEIFFTYIGEDEQ